MCMNRGFSRDLLTSTRHYSKPRSMQAGSNRDNGTESVWPHTANILNGECGEYAGQDQDQDLHLHMSACSWQPSLKEEERLLLLTLGVGATTAILTSFGARLSL